MPTSKTASGSSTKLSTRRKTIAGARSYKSVVEMVRDLGESSNFADRVEATIEARQLVTTLVSLRMPRNVTQAEMAKRMKCTQSRISKLENGADRELRIGEIRDYAAALGMDLQVAVVPKSALAKSDAMNGDAAARVRRKAASI